MLSSTPKQGATQLSRPNWFVIPSTKQRLQRNHAPPPPPSVRSYVQHRLQGKQTAAKWMMLSSTPKQGATQLVVIASAKQRLQRNHPPWECEVMRSTDCKAIKQLQNEWCFPPLRSKVQHNWVGQIGLWYLVPSKGYKEITPPDSANLWAAPTARQTNSCKMNDAFLHSEARCNTIGLW